MSEPKGEILLLPPTTSLALADVGATLSDGAKRYLDDGLEGSQNTRLGYTSDLRSFEKYCTSHELTPYPATIPILGGYIAHLADAGRKLATIKRHLAAIEKKHYLHGHPSLVGSKPIHTILRGIARTTGKRQRQAPAFSVEELKAAVSVLDLSTPGGLRDRALLLVGFAGAFRRSELVALDLEQFELTERALLVKLAKSKTNQEGETENKAVFYSPNAAFCPVSAFLACKEALGRETGPLFVSLVGGAKGKPGWFSEQRLSDHAVNEIVKRHLGTKYSAHSLRASFITTARLQGQTNEFIMNQTKQKTDAMIQRYTRLHDVIAYNAAQNLGL